MEYKRYGILGGSFDPPHKGHLFIAKETLKKLKLEKIFFIPANIPPHKKSTALSPPLFRLIMTHLLTLRFPHFYTLDIEIKRGGVSYTKDTLIELRNSYKDAKFYFIIGSDTLNEIDTWKEPQLVLKLAEFLVVKRSGFEIENKKYLPYVKILEIQGPPISSSIIREKIKAGESISDFVEPLVERFIKKYNLYKSLSEN